MAFAKLKKVVPGMKDKKWRKDDLPSWNSKTMEELKQQLNKKNKEIAEVRSGGQVKSHDLRIIVVGKSGHGKSSLINTINSALSGSVMHVANTGGASDHVTNTYREYKCGKADRNLSFDVVFGDLRGLGAVDSGVDIEVVQQAILGRLPPNTKLEAGTKVEDVKLLNPRSKNEVGMIFFVCDILAVEHFHDEEEDVDNFKRIKAFCDGENIAMALFLTKCDALDENLNDDISRLHTSTKVRNEVKNAAKSFGIQESLIFPVKNCVDVQILSPGMAIQILYALSVLLDTIRGRQVQKVYEEEAVAEAATIKVKPSSIDETQTMSDAP